MQAIAPAILLSSGTSEPDKTGVDTGASVGFRVVSADMRAARRVISMPD